MHSIDPELEPSSSSFVGRWVLWVPALALAFYLGSISRGQLAGTDPAQGLLSSTSATSADGSQAPGSEARTAFGTAPDPDAQYLARSEVEVIDLFKKTSPSVVYITTVEPRRVGFTRTVMEAETGSGSGFIWDNDGHVVTNYHVIRSVWDERSMQQMPSDRVRVTLADQSEWDAQVLGVAPEKDLAVLRLEAPSNTLRPLERGTSDNLQVGQSVYAIGNPFGLDQTLTTGVVSALNREIRSIDQNRLIRNVVQTDAAINPGNSGGPLLDSRGRLIGVNTQIASTSGSSAGIGFAIPVDTVRWVVPDLIEWGAIARPTLGLVNFDEQWLRRSGKKGVLILEVNPDSGAGRAGLRGMQRGRRGYVGGLGDIIIGAANQEVNTFDDLLRTLESLEEGDRVPLRLVRDDKEITVEVELGPSNAKLLRQRRR